MRACMRRHFAYNWVVAWGPGCRSDLALEWEAFRAARAALAGVVTPARAREAAATYAAALPELRAQLASFLVEGRLKVGGALQACIGEACHTRVARTGLLCRTVPVACAC